MKERTEKTYKIEEFEKMIVGELESSLIINKN